MFVEYAIIGGGQAGIPLAHALAQAGHQVVLIERAHLGGSCINFGCTPTKAVIASARVAYQARRGQEFGLDIPKVGVDFQKVLSQARKIVEDSRSALSQEFEKSPNLSLIRGNAKLNGRDRDGNIRIIVSVGVSDKKNITARKVILNPGTHAAVPEIPGLDKNLDQPHVITAETWLDQEDLPRRLIMLGSGYIGVEMAQFYRRMGAEVIMIEPHAQILSHEDSDIADALEEILKSEGIESHKNSSPMKIKADAGGWTVYFENEEVSGSHLFIATGRKPNTGGLGLDSLGIERDKNGVVKCDSRLATNAPGVWVAGDVRGGFCFTHTSWDDFRILQSFFLGDGSRTLERIVPYAIFSDPELGRVGLSEKQAAEKYPGFRMGKFMFADNGKAKETRESRGFIKLIAHPVEDVLLGAAVLGTHGSELVQLYVTLMNAKAPYSVIRDAIYIHPTLAEAAQSVVSEIPSTQNLQKKAA